MSNNGCPFWIWATKLMLPFNIVLAAAAASAPAPPTASSSITIGTTTMQAIMDQFGKPNSSTALGDGTQILVYVSGKTHVKGTSYVPIVGLFASGAKSSMAVRTFTFGPDGVLRNYTTTDTSADCSAGLLGASCH